MNYDNDYEITISPITGVHMEHGRHQSKQEKQISTSILAASK